MCVCVFNFAAWCSYFCCTSLSLSSDGNLKSVPINKSYVIYCIAYLFVCVVAENYPPVLFDIVSKKKDDCIKFIFIFVVLI